MENTHADMPMLTIIRGWPGQGKSTFARTVFSCPVFENDMFFIHNGKYEYDGAKMRTAISWCMDSVKRCLKAGIDCCVANTFTRVEYVDAYVKLANECGAKFKVFRMKGDFTSLHDVPETVLDNMKRGFEDYDGETYAYPNPDSRADPIQDPYILTNVKVGDKVIVQRFADHKKTHSFHTTADGKVEGDSFEMEECVATVTDICKATYDYLNIFYVEDDTHESGMTSGGFMKKA